MRGDVPHPTILDIDDETTMSQTKTSKERCDINRQNASHSTGPKTAAGKAKSSRNAVKHGLCAEKLALPNEDPAALAARAQEWTAHYKPRNPGEAYLVTTAVRATIQLDRGDAYQTATLSTQVRSAQDRWDQEQYNHVEKMVELLSTEETNAVRGFRQTAQGCRWLIKEWKELRGILVGKGYWARNDYEWSKII